MKAFTPFCRDFQYPVYMELIIDYLRKQGTINVGYETLEKLYSEFSRVVYDKEWTVPNPLNLEKFANWLSDRDI